MAAVGRYAPPLVLMAVIFALSAQPDLNSGLGTWDTIGRKLIHMGSYGLLWWLWWRALGWRAPALAVAITLVYAATDEFHQHFVHGRHGSPVDVAIDAAGVALALIATARVAPGRLSGRRGSAARSPRSGSR
jgi:VanZ family protein